MILNNVEFKCTLQLQFILQSKNGVGAGAIRSILICTLNATVAMSSVL